MSEEITKPTDGGEKEGLKRATNVTTKRTRVRLDQIVMEPEKFCHRPADALSEEKLKDIMDSLVLEGMQVPIEGYLDKDKRYVLIKGHRRVMSHKILVGKNTPNFSADMELEAIQLENATLEDVLVRSIADNAVRLNLDRVGRIRAAKRMHDAGVEEGRAAAALGVSTKTYQRDLLIAKYEWMFVHVMDGSIEATAAYEMLKVAEEANRVSELRADLDAWIAEKKRQLRQKEKLRKVQGGKELSPSEKQVRRMMPRHLVNHWLDLVGKGERFDEEAEWDYAARLDKEKGQLYIGSINLNLDKGPVEQIAKVAAKLSLLSKLLVPVVQKRLSEQGKGRGAEEPPYDLDYLNTIGATELANHLLERLEKAKAETTEGEAETGHDVEVEPRQEVDLAATIELAGREGTEEEAVKDQTPPTAEKQDEAGPAPAKDKDEPAAPRKGTPQPKPRAK